MAVPYGENQYIYGLHDPGGEHLLKHEGQAKGWVLVTEEIRANPNDQGGKKDLYKRLSDQGLGVVVRLNHAYGPDGTIPKEAQYRDFAQRAANFVRNSPGAHIWIIGNEMNFEREQPRLSPGNSQAEPITPRRYAECYKLCRRAIKALPGHENDQVVVGAIGPWNAQTPYPADPRGKYPANQIPGAPGQYPYNGFFGDFIVYMRDILVAIGRENCDAIAIHAYSHGYDPALVFNNEKMGTPFQNYHFHFRTYIDQMQIIPAAFRDLPVYLTEANGDVDPNGVKWPDVNSGWVKNAYKEINKWNQGNNQQIRCVILYRWSRDDDWHIDGKGQVHQDLREAVAQNYTWRQAVLVPQPEAQPQAQPQPRPQVQPVQPQPQPVPAAAAGRSIPRPAEPGYRTRYLNHNTPTSVTAGQTLPINLTLRNDGSFTWVKDGKNPFRLGFQWVDSQGQLVPIPPQLDFRTSLPRDVPPDGVIFVQARLRTPTTPGTYQLRWDMVHELVTWFITQGDAGLLVSPITVSPAVVEPQPEPVPVPQPQPTPTPSPAKVQIQNVIEQLAQHSSKRYARRQTGSIKRIVIHHTGTPANITVERIAQFLVDRRDLPGITYHFCVTEQGLAYQTQPLVSMSAHAGQNSRDSVGVALIGNFTETAPPAAQINTTAVVLAQLLGRLKLTTNNIVGYQEIERTQSPGATWPSWKPTLLAKVNDLLTPTTPTVEEGVDVPIDTPPPATSKPIEHYMLFWHQGSGNWAEWDLRGAIDYIARFPVTMGFSIEEAKLAQAVTIVGGPGGVPASVDQTLRAAGCKVDRLAGTTQRETRQMLETLASQGQRFKNLR